MISVAAKTQTHRIAVAQGTIRVSPATFRRIRQGRVEKGDPLEVARIAGIQAVKRTPDLLPLCHPLAICGVGIECSLKAPDTVFVRARVEAVDRTGVEMEALTAASVACLTIYDMCKAYGQDMAIGDIVLLEKSGGKSGHYVRRVSE